MDARIPVTVVTGFLGAGKSTLVERWLGELPPDETAVIVNEQGDVVCLVAWSGCQSARSSISGVFGPHSIR